MRIQISDSFNYKKLIRFVLPSIFMMTVTSIYGVIDGLFSFARHISSPKVYISHFP